jgi:heptosyltransferase-2
MRIVVFCPNWVGDAVMATPTLRALRAGFPHARIIGVMKPVVADTLHGGPWFDDRWLFDPKGRANVLGTLVLTRRLRAERFDLAVVLPNSLRSALLAWLGGAQRRIGYARGGRDLLLTDRLEPLRDESGRRVPVPAVGSFLAIARKLGCRVASVRTELYTSESDESAADRAWNRLGLTRNDRVVCLNTGGAFGPAKNWPTEHFTTLAKRLADEAGVSVLIVCGPRERAAARAIAHRTHHPRVVSLADLPLSIGLTKACVRRSALLVTTDSGPRHFAAPFGVPVLTLFGPTHIAWTRTYHPHAIHIAHPVPCGPCQKRVCPLGHHRCMRELNPHDVFAVATRLLNPRGVPARGPSS